MPSDAFSQLDRLAGRTQRKIPNAPRLLKEIVHPLCCEISHRKSSDSFCCSLASHQPQTFVPEGWLTQEVGGQGQREEKPMDSQQEERRTALTAMVVGRGREARLVHCWSRAKGTFHPFVFQLFVFSPCAMLETVGQKILLLCSGLA